MSNAELAVIALLVILVAVVICRKDVKAAFNFLGVGWFELEATAPKRHQNPRERKTQNRSLP
jgi:hypothetical protein